MDSINKPSFYLSVDELIAICLVSGVNVAVFEEENGVLEYAGGCFDAPGEVTCCKLSSNRLRPTRSHFERLITTTELQQIAHEYNRAMEDAEVADAAQDMWDEERSRDSEQEQSSPSGHPPPPNPHESAGPKKRLRGTTFVTNDGRCDNDPSTPRTHPPPPNPHESARPKKRLRSKTCIANYGRCGDEASSILATTLNAIRRSAEHKGKEFASAERTDTQQFFNIEAMSQGPDKRARLDGGH